MLRWLLESTDTRSDKDLFCRDHYDRALRSSSTVLCAGAGYALLCWATGLPQISSIAIRIHKPRYCTGDRFKFQISFAYSVTVRSLENFPQQATLMIALLAQASGSAYDAASSRWARA